VPRPTIASATTRPLRRPGRQARGASMGATYSAPTRV
jgi:hypothetical protein